MDDPSPLADFITNGGSQMPAFGDRLNPEQVDAVVQYVVETFA